MTTSFESSDGLEMLLCKLAGGGSLRTVNKNVPRTLVMRTAIGTP